MFGAGRGRVSAAQGLRIDEIARKHGASFVWAMMPGEGPRYWFTAPNQGAPFDAATAKAVFADLEAEGLAEGKVLVLT